MRPAWQEQAMVGCRLFALRVAVVGAFVLSGAGCGGDDPSSPETPTTPQPAAIAIVSGSGQAAIKGATFAQPIVVKVTAATGASVAGITVTFQVSSGSGTVTPGTGQTDASGITQTTVTAGATAGPLVVTASVASLAQPATANFTVLPLPPSAIAVVSGDSQSAITGAAFAQPLVVKVTDATGVGVAGATVTFQVSSGSGSVTPGTAQTDTSGITRTAVTAGATAGPLVVTASVAPLAQPATANFTVRTSLAQFAGRWIGSTSQNRSLTLWVGPAGVMDSLTVGINVTIISGMSSCTVTFVTKSVSLRDDGSFTAALTSLSQVSGTLGGTLTSGPTASGTFSAGWNNVIICGSTMTVGTGGHTSTGTWQATRSPLTVAGVLPTSGPLAGGTNLTINGWFESQVDSVRIGTGRLGNLVQVSTSKLTGTTPPGGSAAKVDIVVHSGAASVKCTGCFTYNAVPTVSTVSPSSGTVNGGTTVTISGTGFPTTIDSVRFGTGRLGNVVRNGTTSVTGTTPAGSGLGAVDVTVFTTSAGNGTCAGCFTYVPPVTWASLAPSESHTCGLTNTGVAYCWGDNVYGQLGNGTTTDSAVPVAVAGGHTFTSLVAGREHTCGLTGAGIAYCWGHNSNGQLGDGTYSNRTAPVAVAGGLTFASLAAKAYNTCGLTNAGVADCWGSNYYGQLGNGSTISRNTPGAVTGGLAFAMLDAGSSHVCGMTSAGVAYCWGNNNSGQLGNGSTTNRTAPTAVAGEFTFVRLSTGDGQTCGLTSAGVAYCWGQNLYGQLGDGTTINRAVPTAVTGGLTFAHLTGAGFHTCGLTSAGAAHCWGRNSLGQLGDGTTTNRSAPTVVTGGLTFAALAGGTYHTCGLTSSGAAWCWGSNVSGQLGDGTTTQRSAPVRVKSP